MDYNYFRNFYKIITIDLSNQQTPDADPKAIQQINFIGNLDQPTRATMFFIIKEAKGTILDFLQGIVKAF